jgi:hypothetical protein
MPAAINRLSGHVLRRSAGPHARRRPGHNAVAAHQSHLVDPLSATRDSHAVPMHHSAPESLQPLHVMGGDPRECRRPVANLIPRTLIKAVLALPLLVGCMARPGGDEPLPAGELSTLAQSHTLRIVFDTGGPFSSRSALCWLWASGCVPPYETLLYFAPEGNGWLDDQVIPGGYPQPGTMSLVIRWRIADPSRICFWASPRIGEMPSFLPLKLGCIRVFRPRVPRQGFTAVIEQDGSSRTGSLETYPFNAFPASVIDQYLRQVRVLYGGQLPVWKIP